jgi:hypothetical protein
VALATVEILQVFMTMLTTMVSPIPLACSTLPRILTKMTATQLISAETAMVLLPPKVTAASTTALPLQTTRDTMLPTTMDYQVQIA